jgi:hypothetical protein
MPHASGTVAIGNPVVFDVAKDLMGLEQNPGERGEVAERSGSPGLLFRAEVLSSVHTQGCSVKIIEAF